MGHVLTIEKVHEGKWDRAVFDFLAKHRAAFQPPYPSTVALLRTGDAGHAEAYAKAINEHVAKHVPGGYLVTIAPVCDVEQTRPIPPEGGNDAD